MNFITCLPKCELKNVIRMVVNQSTKDQVYIPYLDKDERTNAEAIAKMLLHNMWQKHGLPLSVVLNQGF